MNAELDELIKNRRKSKRRSSLVACEALKLMNIEGAYNEESLTENQRLEHCCNVGFKWLEEQVENFKRKASVSAKLVSKTNSNCNVNMNPSIDLAKEFELLNDEHKLFLKSHTVQEDDILRLLKVKHKESIKVIKIKCLF